MPVRIVMRGGGMSMAGLGGRLFFLRMRAGVRARSSLTVKREEHQAEHVGRRQQRRHHPDRPTAAVDTGYLDVNVLNRISSLLKKPDKKGTPAIASAPIRNVQ